MFGVHLVFDILDDSQQDFSVPIPDKGTIDMFAVAQGIVGRNGARFIGENDYGEIGFSPFDCLGEISYRLAAEAGHGDDEIDRFLADELERFLGGGDASDAGSMAEVEIEVLAGNEFGKQPFAFEDKGLVEA